ncbi:regulator of G-protein signaling 8-like [Lampris incognitus]|uniref:regulator of G-protein signaling 8-like n=1 Tax=Lampris incognitus TaxID=2546036 RepID=UPI0024B512A9|nr:regulator of G-protein signaling 8-like [Lampris incognitus]
MDLFCERSSAALQETKEIKWKSKLHNYIRSQTTVSRVKSRQSATETKALGQSLETLLSQKCGRAAFRAFLKSEFCEENLDFWLACEEFKTIKRREQLARKAKSIYEEFIRTESPRQVNLDFYTRSDTAQYLDSGSPSCFSAAQKKIYNLMENDVFPRFIQSDYCKNLFATASRPESLGKHRKAFKSKNNVIPGSNRVSFPETISDAKGPVEECCTDTGTDIVQTLSLAKDVTLQASD